MRAVQVEDKNAAIETIRREKSVPGEPGSVGCESAFALAFSELVLILDRLQLPCRLSLSRFAFTRDRRSRLEIRTLLASAVPPAADADDSPARSICVLSAMKMEQIVSAPVSGKVTRVCVKESDR